MKSILSSFRGILLIAFLITAIPGSSAKAQLFAGGTGTQGDPFQVATAIQLDSVRHYGSTADTYFIQTAHIDLNTPPYNTGSGWDPIANFRGFYNGDGYTISGLFINRGTTDNVGLFGTVSNNSSPSNLAIQKLLLVAPVVTGNNQVGALVGDISFGDIEQVGIEGGTVTVKGNNGGGMVGALGLGFEGGSSLSSTARIDKSYTSARVIGDNINENDSGYGGLVGLYRERGHMRENLSVGVVTGPAGTIGGLVGHMLKTIDPKLNDNFYLRNSNERDIGSRKAGTGNKSVGVGLTTAQMQRQASYTLASDPSPKLNFTTTWIMLNEGEVLPELRVFVTDFSVMYAGGSGTQADPYRIATAKQLYHIRQLPTLYFQQTADIDMSVAPYDTTNNAPGWTPIEQFNGHYNGNGYTISNLRIKPANTTGNLGLFGTSTNATLENMTLINPFITNGTNVGALAGTIGSARLTNIHIRGGSVAGSGFVGGLAGFGSSRWIITKSSAIGMAIANSNSGSGITGGLVGSLSVGSSITDSYAANNVQGGLLIGGLVGEFWGTITKSYSASVVSGPGGIGGIVGGEYRGISGLATITNSYYNSDSTNVAEALGAFALNTIQMRQQASFTGFDFVTVWSINEGISFPSLEESRSGELVITGDEGWRMLSSPLSARSIGRLLRPLWTQGFPGADASGGSPNLYFWNEASRTWTLPGDTTFIPGSGTGFLMYVYSDDDFDGTPEGFPKRIPQTGPAFSGQRVIDLSFTDTGDMNNDGWNLAGNPYPSSINWDATQGWTRTNMDQTFYVWSDSAGNGAGSYLSWNTLTGTNRNGRIAPWQGFWVKANAASPRISFSDTLRTVGGVLFKQAKPVIPQLKLELEGNGLSSESVVIFHEQAEVGKDPLDAYKLQSLNPDNYLLLGTSLDGSQVMDIQALPFSADQKDLELVMEGSDLNAEFTLNWSPKHLPPDWAAKLVDTETNQSFPLAEAGSHTFNLSRAKVKTQEKESKNRMRPPVSPVTPVIKSKKGPSRFVIRLSLVVSNEPDEDLPQHVELDQNYPNPFNPVTTIDYAVPKRSSVRLEVFDILGRKVATLVDNKQQSSGRYSVRFDASALASGLYIYKLRAGQTILTKKLTLVK